MIKRQSGYAHKLPLFRAYQFIPENRFSFVLYSAASLLSFKYLLECLVIIKRRARLRIFQLQYF
jgi:hypothetical protein